MRQQMTGQSFWAVMQIFFSVSPVVIYLLAGYLISGRGPEGITAGTIVAFTTLQSPPLFPHWHPAASVRRDPIFPGLF